MGVYCAAKARGGLSTPTFAEIHPINKVNNFFFHSRHQCLCYTLHKHHLLVLKLVPFDELVLVSGKSLILEWQLNLAWLFSHVASKEMGQNNEHVQL